MYPVALLDGVQDTLILVGPSCSTVKSVGATPTGIHIQWLALFVAIYDTITLNSEAS